MLPRTHIVHSLDVIIHDVEQQTEKWFFHKKGKMSASNAQKIGNAGKGLDTYIDGIMEEFYYEGKIKDKYSNKDMKRGNENEPIAREYYVLETGNKVKTVGFIEVDEYLGCSPDGLVGKYGLVEIKCPSYEVYYKYVSTGIIDSAYKWQMQLQMFITGSKWCDFVMYNPDFIGKKMVIKRVYRDEEMITKLSIGIEKGIAKIKAIKEQVESKEKIDDETKQKVDKVFG